MEACEGNTAAPRPPKKEEEMTFTYSSAHFSNIFSTRLFFGQGIAKAYVELRQEKEDTRFESFSYFFVLFFALAGTERGGRYGREERKKSDDPTLLLGGAPPPFFSGSVSVGNIWLRQGQGMPGRGLKKQSDCFVPVWYSVYAASVDIDIQYVWPGPPDPYVAAMQQYKRTYVR